MTNARRRTCVGGCAADVRHNDVAFAMTECLPACLRTKYFNSMRANIFASGRPSTSCNAVCKQVMTMVITECTCDDRPLGNSGKADSSNRADGEEGAVFTRVNGDDDDPKTRVVTLNDVLYIQLLLRFNIIKICQLFLDCEATVCC